MEKKAGARVSRGKENASSRSRKGKFVGKFQGEQRADKKLRKGLEDIMFLNSTMEDVDQVAMVTLNSVSSKNTQEPTIVYLVEY